MPFSIRMPGTIALALLLATPSAAQITDHVRLSATDGPGPSAYRDVSVACPLGTQAIGGGASVLGTRSGTAVVASFPFVPDPMFYGWRAQARDDGFGSWTLRVDVVCGVVAGYQIVAASTSLEPFTQRMVEAQCPVGKQLLGGGGRVTGASDTIRFSYLIDLPADGATPERWAAHAWENAPSPDEWGLRVEAICGFLPGRQVVSDHDEFALTTSRDFEVTCPAGLAATGGGVEGIGGETTLMTSAPYGPGSWGGAVRYEGAPQEPWGMAMTVICPEPGGGLLAFAALLALRVQRSGATRGWAR